MSRLLRHARITWSAWATLLLLATQAHAQQPVRLAPRFTPGQTVRYAMDFRAEQEGATSGAIQNPQAPRKVEMSVSAVMRLEVLHAEPPAAGSGARYRLRGTYEKLASSTKSDVPDPQADNEAQLRKLEGRSLEFTLDADGKVSEVTGLEDLLPEQSKGAAQWLGQFGVNVPRKGVIPGKKWDAGERPIEGAPIAGLVWRGESTYLRNEPCRLAAMDAAGKLEPGTTAETCAVILTRFEVRARRPSADPTPEEFRQRMLRSKGHLRGTGESLAYVSLATGWLVSVTQTSSEEMDVTVTALESGTEVRFTGRTRTQSSITLVKESPLN